MTDKQTAASGAPSRPVDASIWRVDGGATVASDERGLDDSVVRMPPVAANGTPKPTAPSSPTVVARPAKVDFEPTVAATVPPSAEVGVARKKGRRTRKARLRLSRIDPWSVMKTVFLFAIAFGIMFWVAIYLVWTIIEGSGLFPVVNELVTSLVTSPADTTQWRIEQYVSMNKVLGIGALIAVINVVLMTALGTIAAFLYNLSANILGGLEVTLAED